jgi:hypothetical protein
MSASPFAGIDADAIENPTQSSDPVMPPNAFTERYSHAAWRVRFHSPSLNGTVVDDMEIHAIDQRVLRDRTSMGGPFTKRFSVLLTRASHVVGSDGAEGHQLDRVDLDFRGANRIATRDLHLRPLPQAERDRDLS